MTDNLHADHNDLIQYLVIENKDRIKCVSYIFWDPLSSGNIFKCFVQFSLVNQPSINLSNIPVLLLWHWNVFIFKFFRP